MSPRRHSTGAAFAALAALSALIAAPLSAQDSLEMAKRRELEMVQRQARESREAAQKLKGQESQETVKLRRTEKELNMTRRRLRTLQTRRGQLDQQLDVTRTNLQRSELTLQAQRTRLGARLRSIYKSGAARDLEFLLSTRSFGQLLARWDYLVMVAEQDRILLEEVQTQKEMVEADKLRLETNLVDIGRNEKKTSVENQRLDKLRTEHETTVHTIQTQREAYEAAAADLERTAHSIQRLLNQLESKRRDEAARARAQGRVPEPYTGDFARGEGKLDWPLRGDLIGHFGPEKHPKWGTVVPNNGIDIASPIGTPVRAVARARVDYTSDDFEAYGMMVILNHGDGYYTLYAHLSEIDVSVGQEVLPGAVIGKSGDTGSLKGAELHFEVRKGGASLDPEGWLK
ncbi:MAG TPA: peptidoglycan DD-metalloendopeptidase family protein [Candidatus Sulfotelmatobacter sp.]|nr:peptidoglycan DD-metalloendopeptidase family protein [Candidatus Sulfotelmatobacter sp.]